MIHICKTYNTHTHHTGTTKVVDTVLLSPKSTVNTRMVFQVNYTNSIRSNETSRPAPISDSCGHIRAFRSRCNRYSTGDVSDIQEAHLAMMAMSAVQIFSI